MIERVREFFERHSAWQGKRLLVAVSGGQDSTVLLHLLQKLLDRERLGAYYFDHGLRAAAAEERAFVASLSREGEIPFFSAKEDVELSKAKGASLEAHARIQRYAHARAIMEREGFAALVTAHHAKDVAETILMKFLEGRGLEGMSPVQEAGRVNGVAVLRPLLRVRKREIEAYARRHRLDWKRDESNSELRFVRNRVRGEILPFLEKKLGRKIEESLLQSALDVQADLVFLEQESRKVFEQVVHCGGEDSLFLDESLCAYPEAIQRRVMRRFLREEVGVAESRRICEDAQALFRKQVGKSVEVGSIVLMRERHGIRAYPRDELRQAEKEIPGLGEFVFDQRKIVLQERQRSEWDGVYPTSTNYVLMDREKVIFPLSLSFYKHGDRFFPLGGQGEKKLKDFFNDVKMSLWKRQRTWVIRDREKIIWICGYRLDTRVKVDEHTRKILECRVDNDE